MKIEDILICITNHNDNVNAKKLKDDFSKYFQTIIIDSKSDVIEDYFDVKLENVYYTGLFNESVNQTKKLGKKFMFFIASDVFYDDVDKLPNILESLDDNVRLWAPSSKGQSHLHCKNLNTDGTREVPYLEGFTFLVDIDLCEMLYPIDLKLNKFGYGIDILLGFNAIKRHKKLCVVDDRYEVYHREGTGYDQGTALNDMYVWMLNNFDSEVRDYTYLYSKSPGYEALIENLKKI